MTNKNEMVCVPRELLERINNLTRWGFGNESECVELRALLAAPREDVRAVVHVQSELNKARELPPFAAKVIGKLQRYEECTSDSQGADIGRHWFDLLTQLGLLNRVQRSPALWEMTQQGEDLLAHQSAPAAKGGE